MSLKVLHLISSPYGIGGAEKLLLDMSGFYDRKNFSIYYCNLFGSPHKKDLFSESLTENGLPKFDVPGYRFKMFPRSLPVCEVWSKAKGLTLCRRIFFTLRSSAALSESCREIIKSLSLSITRIKCLDKFSQKTIDRTAIKMADRIIAVSSAVKADLLENGVKENKIQPNSQRH